MNLYDSPGACSLSPHIVLREASLAFQLVLANTRRDTSLNGLSETPCQGGPTLEQGVRLRRRAP